MVIRPAGLGTLTEMALYGNRKMTLKPETSSKLLLIERNALLGECQDKQFWIYIGP